MKYLLNVQFEFESDDDPSARKKANAIVNEIPLSWMRGEENKDPKIKLRCVYEGREPRTLDFGK